MGSHQICLGYRKQQLLLVPSPAGICLEASGLSVLPGFSSALSLPLQGFLLAAMVLSGFSMDRFRGNSQ